jgi:hypothetical protein
MAFQPATNTAAFERSAKVGGIRAMFQGKRGLILRRPSINDWFTIKFLTGLKTHA